MKKIIVSTAIGLLFSLSLLLPFWLKASEINKNIKGGHDKYCEKIRICDECKRDYDCLRNKCSQFGDSCHYIDENYGQLVEMGSESDKNIFFVGALCGKDLRSNIACLESPALLSISETLETSLIYTSQFFKVGYIINPQFSGILILILPILMGLFTGIYLKCK